MTSPVTIVTEAVKLSFHARQNQVDTSDLQRFLGAVTGDPLNGGRYTSQELIVWARAIIAAVEAAAKNPPPWSDSLADANATLSAYIYSITNPGAIPQVVRDAMRTGDRPLEAHLTERPR